MPDFALFAFEAHPLVHLNAGLNLVATVLLLLGYMLIRRGARQAHGWVMLAAYGVSCLFLISYLAYHWSAGSVKFTQTGAVKIVYLTILFSHVVLAAAVPFLATATIALAILGGGYRVDPTEQQRAYLIRHRRLAKWTLPIWLYVSITGVVVYVMLYHIWPPVTG